MMTMNADRGTSVAQEALTSIEHGCFDTNALQEELGRALEEDRKYKLTDSMKKRAIHTAANYDDFKNLVACADLKPVSQRELRDFSRSTHSTNLSFKKSTSRKACGSDLRFDNQAARLEGAPKTAVDFGRQWRRHLHSAEEKYRYLRLTTPEKLAVLFKSEMDPEVLGDIIQVIRKTLMDTDETNPEDTKRCSEFALRAIAALTKTGRFALNLEFFDKNQIESLREVFELIEKHTPTSDQQDNQQNQEDGCGHVDMTTIRRLYGV